MSMNQKMTLNHKKHALKLRRMYMHGHNVSVTVPRTSDPCNFVINNGIRILSIQNGVRC